MNEQLATTTRFSTSSRFRDDSISWDEVSERKNHGTIRKVDILSGTTPESFTVSVAAKDLQFFAQAIHAAFEAAINANILVASEKTPELPEDLKAKIQGGRA